MSKALGGGGLFLMCEVPQCAWASAGLGWFTLGLSGAGHLKSNSYRGYTKSRTHTVLGPYGMTFLRAACVLNFE